MGWQMSRLLLVIDSLEVGPHTPNMDYIALEGAMGLLKTVPDGFAPGSDIANLSVLGYDPISLLYWQRGFGSCQYGNFSWR